MMEKVTIKTLNKGERKLIFVYFTIDTEDEGKLNNLWNGINEYENGWFT